MAQVLLVCGHSVRVFVGGGGLRIHTCGPGFSSLQPFVRGCVMELSLEELYCVRATCCNRKCPKLLGTGFAAFIVPATNPSLSCRHCGQDFDRGRIDKLLKQSRAKAGVTPYGKGKGPAVHWEDGWGEARTKSGGKIGGKGRAGVKPGAGKTCIFQIYLVAVNVGKYITKSVYPR